MKYLSHPIMWLGLFIAHRAAAQSANNVPFPTKFEDEGVLEALAARDALPGKVAIVTAYILGVLGIIILIAALIRKSKNKSAQDPSHSGNGLIILGVTLIIVAIVLWVLFRFIIVKHSFAV